MTLLRIVIALTLAASSIVAHVVVRPAEAVAGQEQRYTMRVPNEKTSPTSSVQLVFPPEISILSVDEKAGWSLEIGKDPAGRVISATWRGSLAPKESVEFTFRGRNPSKAVTVSWNATQTFQDGSRSEWTGPAGSPTPASRTSIK